MEWSGSHVRKSPNFGIYGPLKLTNLRKLSLRLKRGHWHFESWLRGVEWGHWAGKAASSNTRQGIIKMSDCYQEILKDICLASAWFFQRKFRKSLIIISDVGYSSWWCRWSAYSSTGNTSSLICNSFSYFFFFLQIFLQKFDSYWLEYIVWKHPPLFKIAFVWKFVSTSVLANNVARLGTNSLFQLD